MLKIQLLSLLFTLCMLCLPVQATLYTMYIASYVHISLSYRPHAVQLVYFNTITVSS